MIIYLLTNSVLTHSFASSMDSFMQLLGLILMFCFVLAVTYITTKFVGQHKLGQSNNKNFKVIETYKVATNKYLQLIKVGEKYIVISIGKDDIHCITELSEDEVILPNEDTTASINFPDLLAKMRHKIGDHKNTDESDKTK